jgi:hypothetical protein
MYVSIYLLKKSCDRYFKNNLKENFDDSKDSSSTSKIASNVNCMFLITSIVFFVIELILLIFALRIAISSSQSGEDRLLHILLAITFTMPYLLLMTVASLKFNSSSRQNFSPSFALNDPHIDTEMLGPGLPKDCGCSIKP